ncbi:hypothetical protein SEA_ISSMI_48 [Streptomyces phage Issmi]|uniref:Uncharacterized protein n=1 Tax=Streptomyces phage Issmi TaxID=2725628 RepID=A0A6M3TAN4_9CAUD|nr:hypothetical protein KGG87_gp48 [Streptomyces phage Issmi]QJD50694.1 hypothetical protein SEA_ISSMI_48 [Streptomyces phage Issmi]
MSETTPEPISPPASMTEAYQEFWDDERMLYLWRNPDDGLIYSRPYAEDELAGVQKRQQLDGLHAQAGEAIDYLDARIDLSLAYLANPAPTAEEQAAQVKVLSDLAAYSAGTLKRLIVVLGELTGRPVP